PPPVLFSWAEYTSPMLLEVVARVGLIEGLVAEREVGNDVLEERIGERPPVEEGRVHDLDPVERSRPVGHDPVDDGPPPPFDHPPRGLEGGEGRSEEHTSELQSRVDLVCRL